MSQIAAKLTLVFCEGSDDKAVMRRIADAEGITGLQFQVYRGKDSLKAALLAKRTSRDFTSGAIRRILVTRDADDSWDAAWQAASEAIREVYQTNVQEPCVWQRVNDETEIAAWIAPRRDCSGMIETLCLEAARPENPDTFFCLEQFATCLQERHAGDLHEKEKFAIWSIAAQVKDAPRQRLSIPRAISNLNIDWRSPIFAELATILKETARPRTA